MAIEGTTNGDNNTGQVAAKAEAGSKLPMAKTKVPEMDPRVPVTRWAGLRSLRGPWTGWAISIAVGKLRKWAWNV